MEKTRTIISRKIINGVKKFGNRYEAKMRIQAAATASHKDRFSMTDHYFIDAAHIKASRKNKQFYPTLALISLATFIIIM